MQKLCSENDMQKYAVVYAKHAEVYILHLPVLHLSHFAVCWCWDSWTQTVNQKLILGPSEHALQSLSAVTVGGPSRREVTPTASMPWRSRPAPPRHYQHRRGRAAPDAAGAPRLRGNSRRPQELARWRERCCGAAAWWVLWRRGWRGRALRMQLTKPH